MDAKKLALYHSKGLLTNIHIPTRSEETDRSLIRSRAFLVKQMRALKLHTLTQFRLMGISYRKEIGRSNAEYWTNMHIDWLKKTVNKIEEPSFKTNLSLLLMEYDSLLQRLDIYNQQINQLADKPEYKDRVSTLTCYRGIDILTAMTLITELGDINRFDSPTKITSYAGMDLREYTSGGKERKYRMTKNGSKNLRTTAIESCQLVFQAPRISKKLKQRRTTSSKEAIQIADKCMKRLYSKSMHLIHKGKMKNKVKVACARELFGFIWESLRLVSNTDKVPINMSVK